MVRPNAATDDDDISVESASAGEQLSFWSLTVSFMIKLVVLGVTLFILPYNEWIMLRDKASANSDDVPRIFMRGVSGSDCVRESKRDNAIDCVRWSETQDGLRDDFWTLRLIIPSNIEFPSFTFRAVFWAILIKLIVYVLDMGATLAMCCRYRIAQKRLEKRIAILCYLTLFGYAYVIIVVAINRFDFLHGDPAFQACLGNAFRLYVAVVIAYNVASALIFYTEIYRPALSAADSETLTVTERVRTQLLDLLPQSSAKYEAANSHV